MGSLGRLLPQNLQTHIHIHSTGGRKQSRPCIIPSPVSYRQPCMPCESSPSGYRQSPALTLHCIVSVGRVQRREPHSSGCPLGHGYRLVAIRQPGTQPAPGWYINSNSGLPWCFALFTSPLPLPPTHIEGAVKNFQEGNRPRALRKQANRFSCAAGRHLTQGGD
jgi:hypothetical protein